MSQAKRLLDETDEARGLAIRVAAKAGNVKICEIHDESYETGDHDMSHAYALASMAFKNGEFSGDRVTLMDAIRDICSELPDECWMCAKLAAE